MSEVYGRYPRNGRTAREMAAKVGVSVRTARSRPTNAPGGLSSRPFKAVMVILISWRSFSRRLN